MQQQERVEIRANIKFCRELCKTPTETYKMLRSTKARSNVSRTLVFKWFHRFEDGRESLEDDKGRGRHAVIGERHVTSLKKALDDDPRMTVRELAEVADFSIGLAYSMLKTTLNMRKVSIVFSFYFVTFELTSLYYKVGLYVQSFENILLFLLLLLKAWSYVHSQVVTVI